MRPPHLQKAFSGQPDADSARPQDQAIPFSLDRALGTLGHHVQINAPLLPADSFLEIVPGSHIRPETTAEVAAAREGGGFPWAASAGEKREMPGAVRLALEPGDIAYYNSNLWHRGYNPEGRPRWTMHCSCASPNTPSPITCPAHRPGTLPAARLYSRRCRAPLAAEC